MPTREEIEEDRAARTKNFVLGLVFLVLTTGGIIFLFLMMIGLIVRAGQFVIFPFVG